MEHTKKFVLVDPRFARPSMREKALSQLDVDISNILNNDAPDEIKAKNYFSALARFKNLSAPPKPAPPATPVQQPPIVPLPIVAPPVVAAWSPPKRPHKRIKLETDPSVDPTLWRRTQRTPSKKKFGTQWISLDDSPVKRGRKKKITWKG